jgi:transmembrane sensor
MQQQDYIEKWLNGTLSEQEKAAFERTEDFRQLQKLDSHLQAFKAPDFPMEETWARLQHQKTQPREAKAVSLNWLTPLLRVAAVILFAVGVSYVFLTNRATSVQTQAAQQQELELPDGSHVTLNAVSSIAYHQDTWNEQRAVELEGEAFFKVAKGSRFDVKTNAGTVTVLGTQFNVKVRKDYFEVVCYEGRVQVIAGENQTQLTPGSMARVVNGVWTTQTQAVPAAPHWVSHESIFQSVPYREVLDELERQYNITVTTRGVDDRQLFSGGFVHADLDLAVKAVAIPLNLTYVLSEDKRTLVLSGESQ